MWAWWLIFLLFVGALGYFVAWFIFYKKFDLNDYSSDKTSKTASRDYSTVTKTLVKEERVDSRLDEIENRVNLFASRQLDLLSKLEKLEEPKREVTPPSVSRDDDGEWEEMYYEIRDKKEQLEEEVETLTQSLKEKEELLNAVSSKHSREAEIRSQLEIEDLEKEELRKTIHVLERKLQAAAEREARLDDELQESLTLVAMTSHLRTENANLVAELNELRNYVTTLKKKSQFVETSRTRIAELQYQLNTKEDEKQDMRLKLEEILEENQKLVTKIKDFQIALNEQPQVVKLPRSKN
jgi:chromosome segregation ATPase